VLQFNVEKIVPTFLLKHFMYFDISRHKNFT